MTSTTTAFPMPEKLEPALERIHAYWHSLKRGENDMPFSDDIDPTKLAELAGLSMLLTAFEDPARFRFEAAGEEIVRRYGAPLKGEFSDELAQKPPVDLLTEQCLATVTQRAPTCFRAGAGAAYARLLLPTWGEGHVALLLGGVDFLQGA